MKTRYSKTTGAFYPLEIDYPALPDDIEDVDQDLFDQAMARPAGHEFKIVDGQLVVMKPLPPEFADAAAAYLATVRSTRELILNRLAGMGMAAMVNGDTAAAAAVRDARQALLNITTHPAIAAATTMDELEAAMKGQYKAIAGSVPASVRTAFNLVDA